MKPLIDCDIWSILPAFLPGGFHLIEKIYYHNSLKDEPTDFNTACRQIPSFEIENLQLLFQMDKKIVEENHIPIIRCYMKNDKETWTIDTSFYERYTKLQPLHD